jgi:TRAP transporter 4TM/12TM fusion protein
MTEPRRDRLLAMALLVVALAMFAYHMVASQIALLTDYQHQDVHLGFLLTLIFLQSLRQAKSGSSRAWCVALLVAGIASTVYVFTHIDHLEEAVGFPGHVDLVVGVALVILVIEGTRRTWGLTLPIVAVIFIAYFMFGHLLPDPLYHRQFGFGYMVSYLSIGLSGIFGTFLGISAQQVFLFAVFGGLLGVIRITDFFHETGKLAGRAFQGGPGQTAVISSSLMGMVTGAAVANAAIVGAFTIPYMKRVGYKPEIAAAIEATASTGGQIMPPVMGAAAFLMASFLGVPYATIMLAGVLPAILYYWGCILGVQFIAVRYGIFPAAEPIDWRLIMKRAPLFLGPVGLLVVMLLFYYSPSDAAFWTILVAIGLSLISRETRPKLGALLECLAKGAYGGAQIGVSLAVVGLIAQTLISTGLGTKIAGLVALLSAGNLAIALVITMLVSLILGCGVPTSAAYSLVAIVVVPTIVRMGVMPLSAHFFAFYFAVISSLTPPVALAALTTAAMAGADYVKTGGQAVKLAISGFLIPFLIVCNPVLILHPDNWVWGAGALASMLIGITALTAALYGCGLVLLTRRERVAAVLCVVLELGFSVFRALGREELAFASLGLGLAIFAAVLAAQMKKKRSSGAGRSRMAASVP